MNEHLETLQRFQVDYSEFNEDEQKILADKLIKREKLEKNASLDKVVEGVFKKPEPITEEPTPSLNQSQSNKGKLVLIKGAKAVEATTDAAKGLKGEVSNVADIIPNEVGISLLLFIILFILFAIVKVTGNETRLSLMWKSILGKTSLTGSFVAPPHASPGLVAQASSEIQKTAQSIDGWVSNEWNTVSQWSTDEFNNIDHWVSGLFHH